MTTTSDARKRLAEKGATDRGADQAHEIPFDLMESVCEVLRRYGSDSIDEHESGPTIYVGDYAKPLVELVRVAERERIAKVIEADGFAGNAHNGVEVRWAAAIARSAS